MTRDLLPHWEIVLHALQAPEPRRFRVLAEPEVLLQTDPGRSELTLLMPRAQERSIPASGMAGLTIREVESDRRRYLAATSSGGATSSETLAFFMTVAERLRQGDRAAEEVLDEEVNAWRSFLKPPERLGREHEIGLLGELWVLHRLIGVRGTHAAAAWVAGRPESHDFRADGWDLEVKTTVLRERRHVISSPFQVQALPGHQLWFASLQVAPVGPRQGATLPEAIEAVLGLLTEDVRASKMVRDVLAERGYDDSQRAQYDLRVGLRDNVTLIPVNRDFPAISRAVITRAIGSSLASRVDNFRYSVNLEGLGFLDGSPEASDLLPAGRYGGLF